jgi:hypothetical protein
MLVLLAPDRDALSVAECLPPAYAIGVVGCNTKKRGAVIFNSGPMTIWKIHP